MRRVQPARPLLGQAGCQWVRGVCIAGKPGSYSCRVLCWSRSCLRWRRWGVSGFAASASRASPAPTAVACSVGAGLACDGVGGVSVGSRSLHRGQARLLQAARALLELACLRWRRWGACGFAVFASRASPAPTAVACSVGAGLACDGVGGVSVGSRRLYRGQARLLQVTWALLELACLRWRRRGVREFAVAASRARPAPTACAGSVGAGLPAMVSVGCQWVRAVCIAGKPGSYRLRGLCWSWLACDGVGGVSVSSRWLHRGQARLLQAGAGFVGAGLPAIASVGCP